MVKVQCANCVGLMAQDDLLMFPLDVAKPRLAPEERVLRA
jgi:hypothetical protein